MDRPAKRTKLLSDDSSSDESEQTEAVVSKNGFKVNEEYARRFEHNKKREEKHRLEEKYNKPLKSTGKQKQNDSEEDEEEDSEDEESEDDDGELVTQDVDDEIFATLNAIKNKDPRVYDKSVQFYRQFDADADAHQGGKDTRAEKPLYLQDYHRQNLMAGYTGEEISGAEMVPQTYDQEQDAVRRQLVDSMHTMANGGPTASDDESEEDDFLVTKSKTEYISVPPVTKRAQHITEEDIAGADKDPETYLSNFMTARAWVPNETSRWKAFDSDNSDDEKRADEFEQAYNMRFEDPQTANEKLQSFARDVGKYGVRRSEKTVRQRARDREKEEKEAAKSEREEERARLRKLKIEEAEEKVRKIKQAAGLRGKELDVTQWRDIIDGDFDDATWEEEMSRRFGADYYAEDENGSESGDADEAIGSKKRRLHKPEWDDDIDIKDLVPDFEEEEEKPTFTLSSDEDDAEAASPAEDVAKGAGPDRSHKKPKTKKDHLKEKAEAKRTARRERRQIESLVDSSLPLSHPALASSDSKSAVGGFRYRETSPVTFGLSTRDILFADDSQLNQYAGLKKMAAFRDDEKKRKDKKRYSKKGRLREWRKETFGSVDGPRDVLENSVGISKEPVEAKIFKSADGGNVVEGARKRKRKSKNKNKSKTDKLKA